MLSFAMFNMEVDQISQVPVGQVDVTLDNESADRFNLMINSLFRFVGVEGFSSRILSSVFEAVQLLSH